MSETVEILRRARERIADPSNWMQGDYGDIADVGPMCAAGALHWAMPCFDSKTYAVCKSLLHAATGEPIITFNDTHSHADVLAAFDRAIEIAEAQS